MNINCDKCSNIVSVSPDVAFNDLGWSDRPIFIDNDDRQCIGYRTLCPHCINAEDNGHKRN